MSQTGHLDLAEAFELLKFIPSMPNSHVSQGDVRRTAQHDSRKRGLMAGHPTSANFFAQSETPICQSRQFPSKTNTTAPTNRS